MRNKQEKESNNQTQSDGVFVVFHLFFHWDYMHLSLEITKFASVMLNVANTFQTNIDGRFQP